MLEIIIFTLFRKITNELSSCDGYRVFLFLFFHFKPFYLNQINHNSIIYFHSLYYRFIF